MIGTELVALTIIAEGIYGIKKKTFVLYGFVHQGRWAVIESLAMTIIGIIYFFAMLYIILS